MSPHLLANVLSQTELSREFASAAAGRQLRRRIGLLRWHWKVRTKRCVGLFVSDLPRLMRRLEQEGVPAVVLRWFEEVPRSQAEERAHTGDVDLLVDGAGLKTLIALAADQPGPLRCDLYSSDGRKGATFAGFPCFPIHLAEQLLAQRELYQDEFPVPPPILHLRSLAYHLAYHKGLDSGIPSGCHLTSNPAAKRDYGRRLTELADSVGERFERPLTLIGVHRYLKRCGWNIPPALLARGPKMTAWHHWLLEQELTSARPSLQLRAA